MIKRNKLSLFLVAVVMMLSIYYINMPDAPTTSQPTGGENVVTRHPEFASSRLEILEEREAQLLEFENILASSTTSSSEKDLAYTSMQEILELTEREVLAEKIITDLGYEDCLVECVGEDIIVSILNCKVTGELFDEVFMKMVEVFDEFGFLTIREID